MKCKFSAVLLLTIVFACVAASAQIAANLQGRVVDFSGAAISNAQVELTESATNLKQQTITSSTGEYYFSHLHPGKYRLNVSAAGFQRLSRSGISAVVGQTVNAELVLNPGTEQQTVTVNADAPLLQSETSNIQTNIPGTTVVAMPLNSRNFVQLATLAPGVSLPPGTLLPRINGGRPRTNEYLYDGISALQPEPGKWRSFRFWTTFRSSRSRPTMCLPSLAGSTGEWSMWRRAQGRTHSMAASSSFFRNEDLNARNYFARTGPKPEYRRNLYGATLGGPLLRDRLFFFGDYQGIKTLIGRTVTSTVPTAATRRGVFTGVAHIFNPNDSARPEFEDDVINVPLDPVAEALLARFPLPTKSGSANNYVRTANDADHPNQFDLRIDGGFRQRDRAFGRYSYFSDVEQPVTPFPDGSGAITGSVIGTGGVIGLSNVLGQQAVFNETHIFSGHLLNDLRLGYTRRGNSILGTELDTTASAALNIPGIPTNAAFNNALPLFSFTGGYQQLGPSTGSFSQYQTAVSEGVDTLVFTHGRHSIKAGFDIRHYELNTISPPNPTGSFAFTTTGSNKQGFTPPKTDPLTNGNALASFLLGQVDTFSIDLQVSKIRPRDWINEYFVQDDWRATDRLTLNLGVRWTLHFPSTEKNDQGAVFNLGTQQLDYLGQNGFPHSARELHYTNVAPRIGLSYMVTPKTVVRSGFGIVFIDQSGITTPFTVPQFPFIQNVQQKTQDSVTKAFQLSSGPTVAPIELTPDAGLGQSVYTVKRKAGSGYVEQWNLAVQRSLTNNLSVEVAYVGSHIVHVGIPDANLNQLTVAQLAQGASLLKKVNNPYYGELPKSSSIGGKTVTAAQLLKPYPRFLNVATYRNNSGTTNYNALEAKIEQRFSHGLYVLFAYTHSKLIDDASSVFSSTVLSSPNSSSLIAADSYQPSLERDSSNGDMPNVTSLSGIYDLPAGRGHRFAANWLSDLVLGGWSLNAIASLQSGMPVTVTQATNNNAFAGFSLQRPNLTGKPSLSPSDRTPARFFNTDAFETAPQFELGNASRNPVRGPAYRDLDIALTKHFKLPGETDIELRNEVFNVTNTPAFAQPNGSFGSLTFGSITSTTTEQRVIQFGLRLSR